MPMHRPLRPQVKSMSAKERARNKFRFLASYPSRLTALQKLDVGPLCLRFCALPSEHLETQKSGTYFVHVPKALIIAKGFL